MSKQQSKRQPRYYAVVLERNDDLRRIVEAALSSNTTNRSDTLDAFNASDAPRLSTPSELDPESNLRSAQSMWDQLKDRGRVVSHPHVTITHSKQRATEERVWIACEDLVLQINPTQDHNRGQIRVQGQHQVEIESEQPEAQEKKKGKEKEKGRVVQELRPSSINNSSKPSLLEFDVTHLVWNDRVMALVVQNLRTARQDLLLSPPLLPLPSGAVILGGESTSGTEGKGKKRGKGEEVPAIDDFLSKLPNQVENRLHVTVGTKDSSIPAVEAKELVLQWRLATGETTEGVNVGVRAIPLQGITLRGQIKGLMG